MLQTMRDNAQGTIAKIIVGFIIIVFALFGVESIVSLGGGEKPVAVVGDLEIFEVDVARTMSVQKQELQRQFGDQFNESVFNDQFLRNSAIERLVNQRVAIQQANQLSLFASSAQIDQTILETPAFQRDGEFDSEQFKYVLRTNALTPSVFRQQLADDLKVQQAQALFILSSFDSPFADQLDRSLTMESRNYQYVQFQASDYLDSVTLEESAIADEYEATKSTLLTQEKVSIEYVEIDKSSIAESVDITDEEIDIAYEAYVAELRANELRQASHILLEANAERDEAASKELAETIIGRLNQGENFEALVKEFSDDIGTKFNGGDLGYNARGTFNSELDEVIFSLTENEVSSPVVSEFGIHVVQLKDIKSESVKELSAVRDDLNGELILQRVEEEFASVQQELANLAFSASTVEEIADAFNAEVKTTELFTRFGGEGVSALSEVKKLAFEDNIKLDREISPVVATETGALVFTVTQLQEPSIKPLDEVTAQIEQRLRRQLAMAKATEAANVAATTDAKQDWQQVTVRFDEPTTDQTAIKDRAFAMAVGDTGVVTIPGGVAVVNLLAVDRDDWQDVTLDDNEAGRLQSSRADITSFTAWSKSVTTIERN